MSGLTGSDVSATGLPERSRQAFALRQRRGVHFVAAASVAWVVIAIVQAVVPGQITRNLMTFVAACILVPGAWALAKLWGIPFHDPSPWAKPGFLFSLNQVLYLPIAMWVYPTVPERFVMVLAVITAAHLLPFSWLYDAKAYVFAAVSGALLAVGVGLLASSWVTAVVMAAIFAALAGALWVSSRPQGSTGYHGSTGDGGSDELRG